MKSIKLILNYQSGASVENIVNYVHFEGGKICFTVKKQVRDLSINIVKVPITALESFDIVESDRKWQ